MRNIRSRMVQSISWSLAGNWVIRGVGVLKMMVLARILSPQDFGVIGAALLAINCLGVFSDVGIGAALIQKKDVDRKDLDTAWTMTIVRGIVLFALLFAAAGILADYFARPDLKAVFRVIAVCFVLEGFTNIGILFFQRDIDFKHKVRLDVVSDLAGSISAVLLALILNDFWALVYSSVIWRLIYFGLSFRLHPCLRSLGRDEPNPAVGERSFRHQAAVLRAFQRRHLLRVSEGQKQRLALARALVGDPDILILDEPTASLDEKTERSVLDAVHQWRQGRTVIDVTHRPSTARRCDRVVVLDGERELENGLPSTGPAPLEPIGAAAPLWVSGGSADGSGQVR